MLAGCQMCVVDLELRLQELAPLQQLVMGPLERRSAGPAAELDRPLVAHNYAGAQY